MRRLVNHVLAHRVDWQYDGVYRDWVASGQALILEKEFWQNAEALVGFLDAYQTFGEARYFEAFENCWKFVRQYMIIPGVGEWRTLIDRQGVPIDRKIGNPWKVPIIPAGRCWSRSTGLENWRAYNPVSVFAQKSNTR